ncbi:zf-HC2 domain-containing protein [Cohnella suwonensis]|uniref:Anti-sigma-W factor RsiW n=2 Tax=Cohnella suwonensis TaxID=696072 RepID=A0ABW0M0G4_9BACL
MQRYIDGDLDEQETSLMKNHADRCPDCAAMLSRLQKLSNELEQLPRVVPKFSLVDAIMPELERLQAEGAMVGNEPPANVPKSVSRSERPARKVFGRLAGVVAAGIVVGFLLFGNPDGFLKPSGSSNDDAAAPSPEAGARMEAAAPSSQKSLAGEESSKMEKSGEADKKDVMFTEQIATPSSAPAASEDANEKSAENRDDISVTSKNSNNVTVAPDAPQSFGSTPAYSINGESFPGERVESPDGKWKAVAVAGEGTFKVYAASDDVNPNYVSAIREGEIGMLSWNADGTALYFTYTAPDGTAEQWQFDVASAMESKR